MPETIEQYIARIRSYAQGQEPFTILAATPGRLRSLVANVPDAQLRARPTPERWSIMEQLAHLTDADLVIGFRVRAILGAPDGVPIAAYDQDRWQQSMRYNDRELAPTLDAFSAIRDFNLRLYRSLDEAAMNKYGLHAERGQESVRTVIQMNAGHDLNHLRQIEAILQKSAASVA